MAPRLKSATHSKSWSSTSSTMSRHCPGRRLRTSTRAPSASERSTACWAKCIPAIYSARSALATLDWRERQGFQHLDPGGTVVFSAARQGALGLDMDKLARHFLPSVRSLHVVPFDDHLAEGSEVDLDK